MVIYEKFYFSFTLWQVRENSISSFSFSLVTMARFCWRRTSSYAGHCLPLSVANVVIGKIKKTSFIWQKRKKTNLPTSRMFYQVSAWFVRQLNSKELCVKTQILRVVEGKMVSERFALENSNKGMVTAILPIVTWNKCTDNLNDFQRIQWLPILVYCRSKNELFSFFFLSFFPVTSLTEAGGEGRRMFKNLYR